MEKGLQDEQIAQAIEKANEGEPVQNILIAQGKETQHGQDTEPQIPVQLASGQWITHREYGQKDYRSQDKITVVYPGVVLKSHGRQREVRTALKEVVFFNTTTGRIEEKPLNE